LKKSLYNLHEQIENKHWWFTARRKIIFQVLTCFVPPQDDLCIVNVGCGTGADLSNLSQSYRCIGLDASKSAVIAAQKRSPNSQIILGSSAGDLPKRRRGETRAWLFLDVLEHVKNERNFFSNFVEEMEPGETTIITTPANPKLWSSHDVSFGHYRRYTLETLSNIWVKLPFEIRLLSYFNTRLYPLIWLIRIIDIKLGKTIGQEETDFQLLPTFLNKMLHKLFYGEHKRFLGMIDQGSAYKYGTSLIAVLTRI
jgi:2-polyprenyl-3-methyl-5-hydroxy-6-metoxy-1,4-benzoquinol methylase